MIANSITWSQQRFVMNGCKARLKRSLTDRYFWLEKFQPIYLQLNQQIQFLFSIIYQIKEAKLQDHNLQLFRFFFSIRYFFKQKNWIISVHFESTQWRSRMAEGKLVGTLLFLKVLLQMAEVHISLYSRNF